MKQVLFCVSTLLALNTAGIAADQLAPAKPACEVSAYYSTFLTAGWFDWRTTTAVTLNDCVADARAELGRIVETRYYGPAQVKAGKFRFTADGFETTGSVKVRLPGRRGD